mmetsp:Transcript_21840/g.55177  ORF Transcript_21840/g.55177 Transcript_21840/m.55177 type:complete len:85 (+) Transcript_21840:46-300(+)
MFQLLRKAQKYGNDGTCNAVPGWEVRLNPISSSDDENCKLHPEAGTSGLGSGASFGSGSIPDFLPNFAGGSSVYPDTHMPSWAS